VRFLDNLINGYRQFLNNADRGLYRDLCNGQHPHTLVIGCSDSRIIPEEIFSVGPGELFVLRNIGNLCCTEEPSVASAIDYAINHLHVKRIVILSHGDCGAVKASLHPEHLEENSIKRWLGAESCNGSSLEEAIKSWGIRQLQRLDSFPSVADAVKSGKLETILLYFDLASLRIDRYNGTGWMAFDQTS